MTRNLLSIVLLTTSISASADTITRFRTTLDHTGVVHPTAGVAPDLGLTGWAEFKLTEPDETGSGPTIAYEIHLSGFDVDQLQTPTFDDNLFAVHLHDIQAPDGSTLPYTAATVHALNIYGIPSQRNPVELGHPFGGDDEDLVVDGPAGRLSGVYEDADVVFEATGPIGTSPFGPQGGAGFFTGSTRSLTSMLDSLLNEQLVLIVHSTDPTAQQAIPTGAAIGGVLIAVPEPTSGILVGFVGLFFQRILRAR